MRLRRPTLPRALLAAVLASGLALGPATAVLAHGGGASSDYRTEITGWEGSHDGIELRIVELGSRVELRRTTASSVMVLGYEGEPYLRLDAAGIEENTSSPAHFLNRDRYASMDPPASASATAAPTWTRLGAGRVVRWHDHRAHWMSDVPRADVQADPAVRRVVIDAGRIALVVDGRPTVALVRVTWLPPPARWIWWGAASVVALAVAAGFVFLPAADRALAPVAALGSGLVVLGQGISGLRQVLAAACVAVALGAMAMASRRRKTAARSAALAAAGGAVSLAATRLDVFEHELIAGWLPGPGQRVVIALGAGLCLGALASALVGALGPTEPARTPAPEVSR